MRTLFALWAGSSKETLNLVDTLVANITAGADAQHVGLGGLLYLYGGYVYEAAGRVAAGDQEAALNGKAADSYAKAWALLKDLQPGQPGRAAALAGQARTTALSQSKGPSDGIAVLAAAGYDPATIKSDITNDHDAADILSQGALLLENAGRQKEAANAYRVSTTVRNLQDAEDFSGVGRTLWVNNGTPLPASLALHTGDAIRKAGGNDLSQAVVQVQTVVPARPGACSCVEQPGRTLFADGQSGVNGIPQAIERCQPYLCAGQS